MLMAQQPGQQDLEKQRQQLKREIEQTQELLDNNKKTTKESLGQLALINKKLNLQGNIIENISKDINLLDNTIYKSQKDLINFSFCWIHLNRSMQKAWCMLTKTEATLIF